MLKETNFASLVKEKVENPDALFIAVSRSVPKGVIIERWMALAPSWGLLNEYKEEEITWERFVERFKNEMGADPRSQRQLKEIKEMSKVKDVFLVCWEGTGKNCHRHILIDLINKLP